MKQLKTIIGVILILAVLFTGCQTETPPEPSETGTEESNGGLNGETTGETGKEDTSAETDASGPPEGDKTAESFWRVTEPLISEFFQKLAPTVTEMYALYNKEALQVVDVEETGTGIAQLSDIVFYEEVSGETLNEVLVNMVAALYAPYLTEQEGRDFTVTEISWQFQNQDILTADEVSEYLISAAWEVWNSGKTYNSYQDCLYTAIWERYSTGGIIPIGEDVWLIPAIEGYYRYEGVDVYSFEDYMAMGGDAAVNGLLPFAKEGETKDFVYLLVKRKGVYRLQRMVDMGISVPAYYGEGEDVPEEFRQLVNVEINQYLERLDGAKADWFAEYNGEKIQMIPAADRGYPYYSDDVAFYRADEGETLGAILAQLSDAMTEKFFAKDKESDFVVTEYYLDFEGQVIQSCEEVREKVIQQIWSRWKIDYPADEPEEFIPYHLYNSDAGLYLIGEDMWLLPRLNGYYGYEGEIWGDTLEEYLERYPEHAKNGMAQTIWFDRGYTYILVKEDDIYRLQRARAEEMLQYLMTMGG